MLDILNDQEKDKILAFNEDTVLKNALKKALLYGIYNNGTLKAGETPNPTKNFALALVNNRDRTNEQLGADVRAAVEGLLAVEQAFNALDEIKPAKAKGEKSNPAL